MEGEVGFWGFFDGSTDVAGGKKKNTKIFTTDFFLQVGIKSSRACAEYLCSAQYLCRACADSESLFSVSDPSHVFK